MSTFAVVAEPLSAAEQAELAAIEIAIEDSQRHFASVGGRLMRIRDGRLYRENHATFEDYCRDRWGFRRQVADRLIRAAEVEAVVTNPHGLVPTSEPVARELAPLRSDPDTMRERWAETVERFGPKPTPSQVREVVRVPEAMPEPPPRKDMRFAEIEDVLSILQNWPDPSAIYWPVDELGDVEMVEEALRWLEAWLPKAKASWRAHKALLPKEMRPKAKARRKLRAA